MKCIYLVIILYGIHFVFGESSSSEDVVIISTDMWGNLIFKLNAMLDDNAKLNDGLLDLNQRFELLSRSQQHGNNDYIWRNVFLKFNIMIDEAEKINGEIRDLSTVIQNLNKGQHAEASSGGKWHVAQSDFGRPEEHPSCMAKLTEKVNEMRKEFNEQHDQIMQNFQDIRDEFITMNPNGPISKRVSKANRKNDLEILINDVPEIQGNTNNSHQWTTILRRQDGRVHFNRNWEDYKNGFGSSQGDYFIGLERLHNLTTYGAPQELMVILKTYLNPRVKHFAKYSRFQIAGESEKYALTHLGTYSGDAGDALAYHRGSKFSTRDQNNNPKNHWDCSRYYEAGWWFGAPDCYQGVLTGNFLTNDRENYSRIYRGINWNTLGVDRYLIYAEMLIRPKT